MPNYLLGFPDQYQQGSAQTENVRSTALYLFAQDSWKIRRNVTLNYGLRWELNTPLTDISQRVQTFRPGQNTQIYPCVISDKATGPVLNAFGAGSSCDPGTPGAAVYPTGLVFPGDKGVPDGLTQTYRKAFAPRIGIAWSPGSSGKTNIRAGWGLFYNPIEQLVLEQLGAQPPFGGSSLVSEGFFQTPFVGQFCAPEPCAAGGGVTPNPFNNPNNHPQGGFLLPPAGSNVDWSLFRPILLFW